MFKKYQGLIERGELTDDGFINKDHHISPVVGQNANDRIWIASRDDGVFIVYSDAGNSWCHVLYVSTDRETNKKTEE